VVFICVLLLLLHVSHSLATCKQVLNCCKVPHFIDWPGVHMPYYYRYTLYQLWVSNFVVTMLLPAACI